MFKIIIIFGVLLSMISIILGIGYFYKGIGKHRNINISIGTLLIFLGIIINILLLIIYFIP